MKCVRRIADSNALMVLTMTLTVYALCGDDLRLLCTNEPADVVFNMLTVVCLSVFTFEILLYTIGRDDYFLSFFFLLDIVATLSLVLDLTWVNDSMLGDEDDVNNLRGSRTAKTGARAARVVRVIRLVRIVKLYKAYYDSQRARKHVDTTRKPGGLDSWADDIELNKKDQALKRRESRVGKKLSELTTRRVICLVLMMMVVQRMLKLDESQQFPTSAAFGADMVYTSFRDVEMNPGDTALRQTYEDLMLRYIYYHNWFNQHLDNSPGESMSSKEYYSQLFWIGVVAEDEAVMTEKAQLAQLDATSVQNLESDAASVQSDASTSWMYNLGSMPGQAQTMLGMQWSAACNSNKYYRQGVSLLEEEIPEWGLTYAAKCPDNLRRSERKMYAPRVNISVADFEHYHLAFYFDLRPFLKSEAMFSLLTTLFVCISLCTAALFFSSDANRLVLHPVEDMIQKVEAIRDNPLSARKVADDEFKREEIAKAKARRKQTKTKLQIVKETLTCSSEAKAVELMETIILEKTIIKLGSLLALGFGEAGASIIEHNMNGVGSAAIDAMVEGTRVECIIGCARISDFATATEVLQSKVMTFVNQIAEIVHGVVDEFHGAASKNQGDMFLLIWRPFDLERSGMMKLADMSMVAFVRILSAVHRSAVLASYRGHPGLQQRLGKSCRVNMTCGLHYGWAIEGAVGSEYKVDASYLSPNVSIAQSVERATQTYGVSILVAESVIRLCTPAIAAKCRLIDRVIMAGSVTPMELYCFDIDYRGLTVEPPGPRTRWTARERFRVRQFLEQEKEKKLGDEVHMIQEMNENQDIAAMQFRYTLEFRQVFNMGYQNYSQGEWKVAHRFLMRTRKMLGLADGPSVALLRFMEHSDFKALDDWKGIRTLHVF